MPGSITAEDRLFVETWECFTPQRTAIVKMTARGEETRQIITKGTFLCTSEERIITQDRIADVSDDPFMNGRFRPIIVPANVTVETHPNALSDDEIRNLLAASDLAFTEWLANLDSKETISRMRNLALAEAATITLQRFQQVQARLEQVRPDQVRIGHKDRDLIESVS